MPLALLLLLAGSFADEPATLAKYCGDCHGGPDPKSGFALEDLEFVEGENLWWLIADRIEDGSMPPESAPQPDEKTRAQLLAWLEADHPRPELELGALPVPPVRRYNGTELRNIVREVFGVELGPAALSPDEIGDGFDTHAAALAWNELSFERWVEAAEHVAHTAIRPLDDLDHARRPVASDAWSPKGNLIRIAERGVSMSTNGSVTATIEVPVASRYRIDVEARASRGGDELAKALVAIDGREIASFDVDAEESPATYAVEIDLDAGSIELVVGFPNDFWDGTNDRNLYLGEVALVGPLSDPILPRFQARFLGSKKTKARDAVAAFVPQLWRRPASASDVAELLRLTKNSDPVEVRVRTALVATLASPRFGFLGLEAEKYPEHALAERLAAWLWKSLPDEELLELASAGTLAEREVLAGQVSRMLDDARSTAFAFDFASQWLQLRALDDAMPDGRRFPGFDAELARSMTRESQLFFEAVLRERRPLRTLLQADFSYLDARLAKHYAVPGEFDDGFRRTRLPVQRRSGVLGHAGVLTVTSNPTRTSPVLRGKWILEALLDEPPPPPPPDAANLAAVAKGETRATLRERLERHRDDPDCAACHAAMDPLGFALESFDAVGAWRTSDEGLAIDARGKLPDGRSFDGPRELAATLVEGDRFLAALVRRMSVYALGRSLVPEDTLWVIPLVERLPGSDTTLYDLVQAIASSPAFLPTR